MDSYSPEDAAGDLMLEVGEPRPMHELRTPGAWRWLAPLAVCVTFAGAVGISILAVPEPASFEVADPVPGMAAPDHIEPIAESPQVRAPTEPDVDPPAEAPPLAPAPATLAAATEDASPPRAPVRSGGAQPPKATKEIAPTSPEPPTMPPTTAASSNDGDEDLPSVGRDDDDAPIESDDDDDDAGVPEPDGAPDDDDPTEPALPGAGA